LQPGVKLFCSDALASGQSRNGSGYNKYRSATLLVIAARERRVATTDGKSSAAENAFSLKKVNRFKRTRLMVVYIYIFFVDSFINESCTLIFALTLSFRS
jgi:hypothetical protein